MVGSKRVHRHRCWQLDEVLVTINEVKHYLWRAFDHQSEVLESFVTKTRDWRLAFKFLQNPLRRHGDMETIVTDRLASYGTALEALGAINKRETGRWLNNRAWNSHQLFRRRERAMLRFRQMRNLHPFTAPFTTTSIKNVTSPAKKHSRIAGPRL